MVEVLSAVKPENAYSSSEKLPGYSYVFFFSYFTLQLCIQVALDGGDLLQLVWLGEIARKSLKIITAKTSEAVKKHISVQK